MTTGSTVVDHPSRRLVAALPQSYDDARERDESLVPEVDLARFAEMASRQAGLITSLGGAVPPQLSTAGKAS